MSGRGLGMARLAGRAPESRRRRSSQPSAEPGEATPGKPGSASRSLSVARQLLPFLGLIGAVLYGVLRLAYVFFYVQVRATPEETGYGYAEVLASQLVGAVWLVLLLSLLLFGVGVLIRLVLLVREVQRRSVPQADERVGTLSVPGWGRLARWAAMSATLLVVLGLPFIAWEAGADAANGFTQRNVYLRGTFRLPVLAVQAVPAHVAWVAGASEGARAVEDRQCLLYLGRADDIAVFYDVASEESIRLPAEQVVITLVNTTGVPDGC